MTAWSKLTKPSSSASVKETSPRKRAVEKLATESALPAPRNFASWKSMCPDDVARSKRPSALTSADRKVAPASKLAREKSTDGPATPPASKVAPMKSARAPKRASEKSALPLKSDAEKSAAERKSVPANVAARDRKSTRLNSSHVAISYA